MSAKFEIGKVYRVYNLVENFEVNSAFAEKVHCIFENDRNGKKMIVLRGVYVMCSEDYHVEQVDIDENGDELAVQWCNGVPTLKFEAKNAINKGGI